MTKTLNALLQIAAINPEDNCTVLELSLAVSEMRRLALEAIRYELNTGNQTGEIVRTISPAQTRSGPERITRVR